MGFSLAAIGELLVARDDAQQADRTTVLQTAAQRLRQREDEVAQRIRRMQADLERAEELREDLRRDVVLCEQRIREM